VKDRKGERANERREREEEDRARREKDSVGEKIRTFSQTNNGNVI
jgi:hypothetical protein